MARLLHSWLCRSAAPAYPFATTVRALPEWPGKRDWLHYNDDHLVALRAPTEREASDARTWAAMKARELDAQEQRATAAMQAPPVAPRKAVTVFQKFVDSAADALVGLDNCPVCGGQGEVEPRPGRQPNGSDATWWTICGACGSGWGTRPCAGCGKRFRALAPHLGEIDLHQVAATTSAHDWPDKVMGRDVWAKPCRTGTRLQFRCPECGSCTNGSCEVCGSTE